MKTKNLISVYEGAAAIQTLDVEVDKKFKILKKHEIRTLHSFCNIMIDNGCGFPELDGYFVGYSIAQICKEFDLIRFGTNYILNIEIKSELKTADKIQKIQKQMKENFYYLKFLSKLVEVFTYVENDGFYKYVASSEQAVKVEPSVVVASIKSCNIDISADPDKIFVPSNYLISPFNSTDKFISNEYFLTSAQQKIKDEIHSELLHNPFTIFCISANAGTGKTLLTYDIAKHQIELGKSILLVHCGKLNEGHMQLRERYNWDIRSIRSIPAVEHYNTLGNFDCIFVDESQRIREPQLKAIISKAQETSTPIIFSFDTKQYLRAGETTDIGEYVKLNYPSINLSIKKLTTKIRTNKEMASFITNLMQIGKSNSYLNYDSVTIEYMNSLSDVQNYIAFLSNNGWMPITYTTSSYTPESYDNLAKICSTNAHDVIGQEFSKVVFVMDNNFKYNEYGCLMFKNSYYSASGMLYQIVTRVVDELKVIVLDNPALYLKLLEIKAIGNDSKRCEIRRLNAVAEMSMFFFGCKINVVWLRIEIYTRNGLYGFDNLFKDGLNFVASNDNTCGKSSILAAIYYCLGCEEILGGQGAKTLTSVFKSEIEDDYGINVVLQSGAYLEITNGLETITIYRSIVNEKREDKLVTVFFTNISQIYPLLNHI